MINYASEPIGESRLPEPVPERCRPLPTLAERLGRRWSFTHTNASLEGFNGLFEAACARALGYRNAETFVTMTYII